MKNLTALTRLSALSAMVAASTLGATAAFATTFTVDTIFFGEYDVTVCITDRQGNTYCQDAAVQSV
jgi:hypothetical protein